MDRPRKGLGFSLRLAVVALLVLVCCVAVYSCSKGKGQTGDTGVTSAQTEGPAPDFKLQDLKGGEVTLDQYRGKVVLLEFWATWCPPCRATVPELIALQKKYKDRDFAVLGISVDDQGENLHAELSDFSRKFHINYRILLGNQDVERDYRIWSIPRSFLIDKDGKIRDSYSGYVDSFESKVSAEIERLL